MQQQVDRAIQSADPVMPPSEDPKASPSAQHACANGQSGSVVTLHLTPEQEALLAPIVRNAVAARSNILFVAVPRNGAWVLQVKVITAATSTKLRRLLNADKEEKTPHLLEQSTTGCAEPAPPH
jgi:hypothetical protein